MARTLGATNRPQFYKYTTEVERKEFAKWVKKNYKNDTNLAKWYGDQIFGKAPQPLSTDPDNPLMMETTIILKKAEQALKKVK